MKLRHLRKHHQARLRYNKSWDWSLDKFIRTTVAQFKKFNQAMQEAYAKAHNEWQLQQE